MRDLAKYTAEFLGTFVLAMVVAFSVAGVYPVATPVLAAITLLVFVYTIGHLSGSNINPAVSLGLMSRGKLEVSHTIIYILVQWIAAVFVIEIMKYLGVTIDVEAIKGSNVFLAEALGAAIFGFGIMAVVRGKVDDDMNGVVIGGSLFLGITVAVLIGSAGALNPAVAYALGLHTWSYFLAPIVGIVLGMFLFDLLQWKNLVHPEIAKEVKQQRQSR